MAKEWKILEKVPKSVAEQFPELSSIAIQLLYNRGLLNQADVEWFLEPDYHNLYDPFLFSQMQPAVDRIWQAISKNEKIAIFADYDADAVTANAVLQQTFKYLGVVVLSYIPDRFAEGYGLSIEAFEKLKHNDVKVVITVDCGTNSIDVANYCRENAIDLIITDHHEVTGDLPKSHSIINPKNPAEPYPEKQLTGVGVAYKLAKAVLSQKDQVVKQKGIEEAQYLPEWDKWLLDLVAIGTVADCHSLFGENRILVNFGLKVLRKTKWLGLRALMENAQIDFVSSQLDAQTIGFKIAPRINAAGRLEHADIALNLLTAGDYAEAITLANRVEEINRRRQDLTARIVSEARERAELNAAASILVLHDSAWPKGLVGIAAGKLAELYKKPVIVLEEGEQESTGSARTSGSFNLVEALKANQNLLYKFGGHAQAAGLTVKNDNLPELKLALAKYADTWYLNNPNSKKQILEIDSELEAKEFSLETYDQISKLEPFGQGNNRPVFVIENCTVANLRLVGASQNHVQLQLQKDDIIIDCIAFSMADRLKTAYAGSKVSVVGNLQVDSFRGLKKLKLRIIDFKNLELESNK